MWRVGIGAKSALRKALRRNEPKTAERTIKIPRPSRSKREQKESGGCGEKLKGSVKDNERPSFKGELLNRRMPF